ncbi:AI-2E family transporter [Sphingomonas sp. MMS24-J13]|uniref:AI-2E family transporter n=1 Tax=Sphingomonas sp. MMS24-J13 TaxID=3238686 RepID=UPI0038510580
MPKPSSSPSEPVEAPGRRSLATRDYVQRILIALAAVVLAIALFQLIDLLLLVFAAVLFAVLLVAIADCVAAVTRLSRSWSLLLAIALLIATAAGLVLLFGKPMIGQVQRIAVELPASWRWVEARLRDIGLPDPVFAWAVRRVADGGSLSVVTQLAGSAASAVGSLLLALVGGAYLALQPDLYRSGLLALVPPRAAKPVSMALDEMAHDLRHWLVGQLVTMAIVGLLMGLGGLAIGLPAAAALGLIAAILEFIPYVGPILTAVPALLLGLAVSVDAAGMTVLLLVVVQQLEGYVLTPLIQRRAVELPPALTLFALFAMGVLFGALGVLLAAPLTVCARILVRHAYMPFIAGDRS